jgi:hypothetical protein
MQFMLQIIADEGKAPLSGVELSGLMQAFDEFAEGIVKSGHFRGNARQCRPR